MNRVAIGTKDKRQGSMSGPFPPVQQVLTKIRTSLSKKLTNADKDDFFRNIKCTIDGGYSNYGITPSL